MIKEKTDKGSSDDVDIGDGKEGRVLHAEWLAVLKTAQHCKEQQNKATPTYILLLKRWHDIAAKNQSQCQQLTSL
jgi:hypothetical protein